MKHIFKKLYKNDQKPRVSGSETSNLKHFWPEWKQLPFQRSEHWETETLCIPYRKMDSPQLTHICAYWLSSCYILGSRACESSGNMGITAFWDNSGSTGVEIEEISIYTKKLKKKQWSNWLHTYPFPLEPSIVYLFFTCVSRGKWLHQICCSVNSAFWKKCLQNHSPKWVNFKTWLYIFPSFFLSFVYFFSRPPLLFETWSLVAWASCPILLQKSTRLILKSPRRETQLGHCSDHIGLCTYLWKSVWMINWCSRAQPTVKHTISWHMVLGCIRKLTKYEAGNKLLVSALSPWSCSCLDIL